MNRVLHRGIAEPLPVAVRGEGAYLFDAAGKRYLDASGGAAVSCLGHSHPKVVAAVCEQVRTLAFAHTSFFTNEPLEALADFLVSRAPGGMSRAATVSDGSVAVEMALKLARQYWLEVGEPSRAHVIARRLSYHGNTLGALSVGGNLARREPYSPMLFAAVSHVAPCYEYRLREPGESAEDYGRRAADELETEIVRLGPRNVAAFIAEPVVGATAGCLPPAPGYLARLRRICDRHGVLFIADEIMCGMGRTGTLFACAQDGVAPDIVVVAKGLAAGYQPIGAVIASERVVRALERGSGALANGHTYMGHPVACAAALAVQRTIEEEGLLDNVRRMGERLDAALRERLGSHPHVGDIRGRGLFRAIELVADRESKQPFDPALRLHARFKREARSRGLIVYPSGGTVDGVRGDHVLFAPPYIVEPAQIDEMVALAAQTLDALLAGSGATA